MALRSLGFTIAAAAFVSGTAVGAFAWDLWGARVNATAARSLSALDCHAPGATARTAPSGEALPPLSGTYSMRVEQLSTNHCSLRQQLGRGGAVKGCRCSLPYHHATMQTYSTPDLAETPQWRGRRARASDPRS
jgi:hypothetical protein